MRLFLIARHGESTLNIEQRINGDPGVPVDLSENGREEARKLGEQIAHAPIGLCVHTRFPRTLQTSRIALAGREIPLETEPMLDDIDVGDLEGQTIEDYRAWKKEHTRADAFPGGESLDDAAGRYAAAFTNLVERDTPEVVLVVCHEIPLRYALNAASGSDDLDGPMHDIRNATPYIFDEDSLERAARRMAELAG